MQLCTRQRTGELDIMGFGMKPCLVVGGGVVGVDVGGGVVGGVVRVVVDLVGVVGVGVDVGGCVGAGGGVGVVDSFRSIVEGGLVSGWVFVFALMFSIRHTSRSRSGQPLGRSRRSTGPTPTR